MRHVDVEESDDLLLELLDLQRLGDAFDLVVWDRALIFLVEAVVIDSLLQTALVPVRLDPLVHLIAELRVELAHQQLEVILVDRVQVNVQGFVDAGQIFAVQGSFLSRLYLVI